MRGISYKWRQQLAMTGYLEAMNAYGHLFITRWPSFNRGNLFRETTRLKAYLAGVRAAKEVDLIERYEKT